MFFWAKEENRKMWESGRGREKESVTKKRGRAKIDEHRRKKK